MGLRQAWRSLWLREAKGSHAGPLLALRHPGRAAWSPRRYDAFAEEGYRRNVVAFRAVNQVTRAAASVPWRLVRRGSGGETTLAAHPLLELLLRPNPNMGGAEFVEVTLGFFLIAGNAFIEAVGPAGGGPPRELWPLRPDRTKVLPSDTGLPEGYVYCVGGAERRWPADPVTGASPILHLKTFNPLDDWYGMSALEAAAYAIDQRNAADAWNMSLLQNGARPSGALVYEPKGETSQNLTDDQFARLKSEITAHYAGSRNVGRPMLLDGGLRWQEMSLSPKDMDFLESRHAASRDIALALGVPPQLLGIPGDNTYSNYQEARLALWEETVIPLLRHFSEELNGWLAPRFGEGLALEPNLDDVPALTLRRERAWSRIGAADFLTTNEKRRAVGLSPITGGDKLEGWRAPSRNAPSTAGSAGT